MEKVEFDYITILSVIPACANLGALNTGKWVHELVRSEGNVLLANMYSEAAVYQQRRLENRIMEMELQILIQMHNELEMKRQMLGGGGCGGGGMVVVINCGGGGGGGVVVMVVVVAAALWWWLWHRGGGGGGVVVVVVVVE
ncbi:hypothetical protein C3L33_16887, partial [Rhododendron williamsianum]